MNGSKLQGSKIIVEEAKPREGEAPKNSIFLNLIFRTFC
jgi:hypothetical protein